MMQQHAVNMLDLGYYISLIREDWDRLCELPLYAPGEIDPGETNPGLGVLEDTWMARRDDYGDVRVASGLTGRIAAAARRHGIDVRELSSEQTQLGNLSFVDHCVPTETNGLADYVPYAALATLPPRSSLLTFASSLAHRYANARVIVATATQEEANAVHNAVNDVMVDGHANGGDNWFLALTAKEVSRRRKELADPDLLIFMGFKTATSSYARHLVAPDESDDWDRLLEFGEAVAVIPDWDLLPAFDKLPAEAIYGPTVLTWQFDELLSRASVIRLGPSAYPAYVPTDPLERRRTMIWSNDSRNELIATAAQAYATDDVTALRRLGVWHATDSQTESTRSVAVIVACAEHAHALRRRLPEWRVEQSDGRQYGFSDCVEADRTIVTCARLHGTGLYADVVIVATGDSSTAGEWWGPNLLGMGPELTVVDIVDDCDQVAVRDTCRRNMEYHRRGFRVA